jgi:hypothetical protein
MRVAGCLIGAYRAKGDAMTVGERLLLLVAVFLSIFGLVMCLGALVEIFDKTSKNSVPSDIALLGFAGILPVICGVWLYRHTRRIASERAFAGREKLILALAAQHGGALTAPQVAEGSNLTLEQAKATLDHLNQKSFNQVSVSESGGIVYTFEL